MADDLGLLIVGAGGHSKVIIELARATGIEPAGLLDPAPTGSHVLGVPILGGDNLASELFSAGYKAAFVALGRNDLRHRIGVRLRAIGFRLPTLIHPSATVSVSATLGDGIAVMPQSVINAEARIGDFAIINTGAVVEHDCIVGQGTHVAPRAVLGGSVTLGEQVFFGIGAVARPLSRIGAYSTIGAGAVVVGEIARDVVAVGVPARPLAGR
jgi:UDP-perosamine 4-acetyltransferase